MWKILLFSFKNQNNFIYFLISTVTRERSAQTFCGRFSTFFQESKQLYFKIHVNCHLGEISPDFLWKIFLSKIKTTFLENSYKLSLGREQSRLSHCNHTPTPSLDCQPPFAHTSASVGYIIASPSSRQWLPAKLFFMNWQMQKTNRCMSVFKAVAWVTSCGRNENLIRPAFTGLRTCRTSFLHWQENHNECLDDNKKKIKCT